MPDLFRIFQRLKAIDHELQVITDAVERVRDAVELHQVDPPPNTTLRDYEVALNQLEPTYLIRLWAEFESALRSYRRHVVNNPADNIRAFDLINWSQGIEAGRKVDDRWRDLVHEVREYRNSLVHERDNPAPVVPINEARRRLSTFLAKLPQRW